MKKQAKSWLVSAKDDLRVIDEIKDIEDLTHMVAFHAQQAIEKTFKAILEENEEIVPKIHNLLVLATQIEKYIQLDIDQSMLKKINETYIDARYPSDLGLLPEGKPSQELAAKMHRLAKQIHAAVKKQWA